MSASRGDADRVPEAEAAGSSELTPGRNEIFPLHQRWSWRWIFYVTCLSACSASCWPAPS